MNADAIQVVTQALRDPTVPTIPTVYVGPLDDPDARNADAVLFLYRVTANAELRNSPHTVPASNPADPPVVFEGALPLDLYYLLTVGAKQATDELPALGVLGKAMQALNDSPLLVGSAVRGELARISLDSVSSEEMGRIWTLFPAANYRTSVLYLVTPVWIDPRQQRPGAAPVVDENYRAEPITPEESLV